MTYDLIVVGGGIVGVSVAWQLKQRYPDKSVLLLEKEADFARHQTGHNSGVVHAGVYYAPGSLKARFCKEGAAATQAFCREHDLPYQQCGKLLVATTGPELARMEELEGRCRENGIVVERLNADQLKAQEPQIVGLGALLVPETAITDFRMITTAMAGRFAALGGEVRLGTEVVALKENAQEVQVVTRQGARCSTLSGRYLVACCGLMADRVAGLLGVAGDFRILPFRGEYYRLSPRHNRIVNRLIYPIPDPALPFLGVHLTKMIDGSVTVGPNAVLGWKREGYGRVSFSLRDCWQIVSFAGFWRMVPTYLRPGLAEIKDSWWKPGYLRRVRKYCPELRLGDLQPYPPGIRAQAVRRDGRLVHDFLFAHSRRTLHVGNAPSPAATAAIPIGRHVCEQVAARLTEQA